jgi:hypothetical protein
MNNDNKNCQYKNNIDKDRIYKNNHVINSNNNTNKIL